MVGCSFVAEVVVHLEEYLFTIPEVLGSISSIA